MEMKWKYSRWKWPNKPHLTYTKHLAVLYSDIPLDMYTKHLVIVLYSEATPIIRTLSLLNTPFCTLLGKSRFLSLKDHYLAYGLVARVHGNMKRLPFNALTKGGTGTPATPAMAGPLF